MRETKHQIDSIRSKLALEDSSTQVYGAFWNSFAHIWPCCQKTDKEPAHAVEKGETYKWLPYFWFIYVSDVCQLCNCHAFQLLLDPVFSFSCSLSWIQKLSSLFSSWLWWLIGIILIDPRVTVLQVAVSVSICVSVSQQLKLLIFVTEKVHCITHFTNVMLILHTMLILSTNAATGQKSHKTLVKSEGAKNPRRFKAPYQPRECWAHSLNKEASQLLCDAVNCREDDGDRLLTALAAGPWARRLWPSPQRMCVDEGLQMGVT